MASQGDFQKRMSAILAEAASQNYKIEEIIPKEMQEHFESLRELKEAKEYVKESEEREKELRSRNDDLEKELAKMKQVIAEMPEEYEQAQTDIKQLEHQVKFYIGLKNDAEAHSNKLQRKYNEVREKQVATQSFQSRIKTLETELEKQTALNRTLHQNIQQTSALCDKIRDCNTAVLEERESRIEFLEESLEKMEAHCEKVEEQAEVTELTYSQLTKELEENSNKGATTLRTTAKELRDANALRYSLLSEIRPMNIYYKKTHVLLRIFQKLLRDLLSAEQKVVYMPDTAYATLKEMEEAREQYYYIQEAIRRQGFEIDDTRAELRGLAASSWDTWDLLEEMRRDLQAFLGTLEKKPSVWQNLKAHLTR